MADEKKELPQVSLHEVEKDAATGMIIRERYICLKYDCELDTLMKTARETMDWKVRR
jgi:hypothetical protein